ncbi:MAG: hypothetical protein ACTHN5_04920 [Phycisphaerae bacterium]
MILLGVGATFAQARDYKADASAMLGAKGKDAINLRTAILDDLNKMNVVQKNEYVRQMLGGSALDGPWAKILKQSGNPDAQLNGAILISEARALSADAALENIMISNPNPAIRYWGAKGLEGILPELMKVGGAAVTRALTALNNTIAHETSGVVKQEIIRALGAAGDVGALQTAADALADQLQSGPADHETIGAAGTAMSQLDPLIKKGATVDKTKLATSAARIASFAAQQLQAMEARQGESGGDVPTNYSDSVRDAVTSAIAVLNDLAGSKAFTAPGKDADSNEIQFNVNAITGSASSGPGSLQKVIPGVPVPPAIKK